MKKIKIVFSSIISDAGEVTRALEIADGIRKYTKDGYEANITFLSNGSSFEKEIISRGFKIYKCKPALPGIGFHQDFKVTKLNLIGDVNLAVQLIKGEIEAFNKLDPDVVIHGFYPIASIARRLMNKNILGICYLPLPLNNKLFDSSIIKDIPDEIKPLTYLPKPMRKLIFKIIPSNIKKKIPIFKQTNILNALKEFSWNAEEDPVKNLFDMLKADLTIVNDFREFYLDTDIPTNYTITGPLYSPNEFGEMDENILKIFSKEDNKLKIFCSLGSSGKKKYLEEVLKSLSTGIGKSWSAVVLAPPSVCNINDVLKYRSENVYITDKFVPALLVNSLADIVISHGGQGTLQTAIASSTPIIGYGMQMEQQINLENIVQFGAGIRLSIHKWNARNIQKSIVKIQNNPSYKNNIQTLSKILKNCDGKKNASSEIWRLISQKF